MVEEVMCDNEVAVGIATWRAISLPHIDFLPAVVHGLHALRGKEDIVIILLRTKRPGFRVVVPFLREQHARLRAPCAA